MPTIRAGSRLFVVLSLLLLVGCAKSANEYYNDLFQMSTKDPSQQEAIKTILDNKDSFYGKSLQIMYYADLGIEYLKASDLKNAAANFAKADDIIDDQYKKNFPGMIAAFTVSEETTDFIGDIYEHVQVSMYLSLIHGELGDWEKAAVHARKANERITENIRIISKAHGFETDPNSEEGSKSRTIKWHYVADALAYYIGSVAYQNIGDKENGLVAARNAIHTYSTPAYRDAFQITRIPDPVVANYCHLAQTIDRGDIRSLDTALVRQHCGKVVPADPTKGRLVVVKLNGHSSTKQSLTLDIPTGGAANVATMVGGAIGGVWAAFSDSKEGDRSSAFYKITMGIMLTNPYIFYQIAFQVAELERLGDKGIASKLVSGIGLINTNAFRLSLPVVMSFKDHIDTTNVSLNGRRLDAELAQNYSLVKYKYVNDTMMMAMVRSASRALFRAILQVGAERKFGFLAGLLVGGITKSVETADTRSLRSFPAYITLAESAPLPTGTVKVQYENGSRDGTRHVKIEKGQTDFCIAY